MCGANFTIADYVKVIWPKCDYHRISPVILLSCRLLCHIERGLDIARPLASQLSVTCFMQLLNTGLPVGDRIPGVPVYRSSFPTLKSIRIRRAICSFSSSVLPLIGSVIRPLLRLNFRRSEGFLFPSISAVRIPKFLRDHRCDAPHLLMLASLSAGSIWVEVFFDADGTPGTPFFRPGFDAIAAYIILRFCSGPERLQKRFWGITV